MTTGDNARFTVGSGSVVVQFDGRVIIIARPSITLQARTGVT
jgi:hypothetical protein